MTLATAEIHELLIKSLGTAVVSHSQLGTKPLDIDLASPAPPRLRCYVYNLVAGGPKRPNEFKGVLRVPGQPVGSYGSFEFLDGRFALVLAYREELDVWVLWDSLLHPRFKNGGNIQVRKHVVLEAAAAGRASQIRRVQSGHDETILCARSLLLLDALTQRVICSGTQARG